MDFNSIICNESRVTPPSSQVARWCQGQGSRKHVLLGCLYILNQMCNTKCFNLRNWPCLTVCFLFFFMYVCLNVFRSAVLSQTSFFFFLFVYALFCLRLSAKNQNVLKSGFHCVHVSWLLGVAYRHIHFLCVIPCKLVKYFKHYCTFYLMGNKGRGLLTNDVSQKVTFVW